MNGRTYVPFKAKKSPSMVSTTDSLCSELSSSTQVIGPAGQSVSSCSSAAGQSNGQLARRKLSASTQRLSENPARTLSHGRLNGSTGTFNKREHSSGSITGTPRQHPLLKKKPFSTSMSSVNNNLNRNWCSMTSLASHQSERTNCTYLLRPSSQLPNAPLNKIDLLNAIPPLTTTRFYLNYSSPVRSVLTSDNELIDCPVHFSHRCNPFTCYLHQMYIHSSENEKQPPLSNSDSSNSDAHQLNHSNHSNLDDVGLLVNFFWFFWGLWNTLEIL